MTQRGEFIANEQAGGGFYSPQAAVDKLLVQAGDARMTGHVELAQSLTDQARSTAAATWAPSENFNNLSTRPAKPPSRLGCCCGIFVVTTITALAGIGAYAVVNGGKFPFVP